uniref:Transcriptional activator protein acu-15 n=1 Tax=Talaromyces marneffei PM1 TaxID=1077442 RepID=A0A093VA90_TALMA
MQSPDLIPSTSEVGSLTANSNDESQFVGSSSGVFFVNTVRRAFAQSLGSMKTAPTPEFPVPEDTLIGSPSSARANSNANRRQSKATVEPRTTWTYDPQIAQCLGEAPGLDDARQLMMTYFKIWHPLFPFLHGPSFLHAMEAFYSEGSAGDELSKAVSEHHRVCWSAIFQCIFNISSTLQPDLQLAQRAKITSAADALKLANVLLNRHDILSLQAILAIQLYLVASMSLRNASLLGGTILRAVLHAGFHRCPFRYQQLSAHDCQLRKRIFWCFYAIDRYLSQALGLPLGIQDSDIDVCLPGSPEIHTPRNPRCAPSLSPPAEAPEMAGSNSFQDGVLSNPKWTSRSPSGEASLNREATLAGFVAYGKLTGRALELFHKSTHSREIRRSAVLYLVSDVHKWWNNLPSTQSPTDAKSSGSKRLQSDNEQSTHFERSKKRRTTFPGDGKDHPTCNPLDNGNYQIDTFQDSQNTTAAPQNEMPQPDESSSISVTICNPFSEPTTTRIYQEGPDDATISPPDVSILAMLNTNNEVIEGLQWPDESSFFTTNFDLNMTDLFQNSSWDPMLFDDFNR